MVICGFAGIGKSTLCKNKAKWIDLESTPFEKDWLRYAKVAKHMDKQGYNVMLSCHKELREELHKQNTDYSLIMPEIELKEEYLKRYFERGNTEEFIKFFQENWDKNHEVLDWEVVKYLGSNQYLQDII